MTTKCGAHRSSSLILSVNKPCGWTSFDVVSKLRRELGWKAIGHAGTLDPPAVGVLIILCGSATRRAREFMALPKEYRARVRFGVTTVTDDLEGEVVSVAEIRDWNRQRIESALRNFVGEIEQVPPRVSAVKVHGRRSYQLVRAQQSVSLSPRRVTIYDIKLQDEACPEIELVLRCSGGTYVRALARDVGHLLGWGGTLAALVRTAIGPFRVERSLTVAQVLRRRCEFSPS